MMSARSGWKLVLFDLGLWHWELFSYFFLARAIPLQRLDIAASFSVWGCIFRISRSGSSFKVVHLWSRSRQRQAAVHRFVLPSDTDESSFWCLLQFSGSQCWLTRRTTSQVPLFDWYIALTCISIDRTSCKLFSVLTLLLPHIRSVYDPVDFLLHPVSKTHVRLFVCLFRWCIVPKRLSWSSCDLHQIVDEPF